MHPYDASSYNAPEYSDVTFMMVCIAFPEWMFARIHPSRIKYDQAITVTASDGM